MKSVANCEMFIRNKTLCNCEPKKLRRLKFLQCSHQSARVV